MAGVRFFRATNAHNRSFYVDVNFCTVVRISSDKWETSEILNGHSPEGYFSMKEARRVAKRYISNGYDVKIEAKFTSTYYRASSSS